MQRPLKSVELTLDEVRWLHATGSIASQNVEISDPQRGLVALPRDASDRLLSGIGTLATLQSIAAELHISSAQVDDVLNSRNFEAPPPDPYTKLAYRDQRRTAVDKHTNWVDALGYFRVITGFDLPPKRRELILCGDLGEVLALVRQARVYSSDVPPTPHPDAESEVPQVVPLGSTHRRGGVPARARSMSPSTMGMGHNKAPGGSSKLPAVGHATQARGGPSNRQAVGGGHRSPPPAPQRFAPYQQPSPHQHRGGGGSHSPQPRVHHLQPMGETPAQHHQGVVPHHQRGHHSHQAMATTPSSIAPSPAHQSPSTDRRRQQQAPWQTPMADATTSPARTPPDQTIRGKEWSAADWFLSPFLQAVVMLQTHLRQRHSTAFVGGNRELYEAVRLGQQRYRFLRHQRSIAARGDRLDGGATNASASKTSPDLQARREGFPALKGQCTRCIPLISAFRQVLVAHPHIDDRRIRMYTNAVCPRCKTLVQCMIRWRPGAEELRAHRLKPAAMTVQAALRALVSRAIRRQKAIVSVTPKFKSIATPFRAAAFISRLRRSSVAREAARRFAGYLKAKEHAAAQQELGVGGGPRPDEEPPAPPAAAQQLSRSGSLLMESSVMRTRSNMLAALSRCDRCFPIHEALQADLSNRRSDDLVKKYAAWMCRECREASLGPLQALRRETLVKLRASIKATAFIVRILSRPRLAAVRRRCVSPTFHGPPGGAQITALYWRSIVGVNTMDDSYTPCARCSRTMELLWRCVTSRFLRPTQLVSAVDAREQLKLPSTHLAAKKVSVVPVADGWLRLLCAACEGQLSASAQQRAQQCGVAEKSLPKIQTPLILGSRLRTARALFSFVVAAHVMFAVRRLKRIRRRAAPRWGTPAHALDCAAGCAPMLEALAERLRLAAAPRWLSADPGRGASTPAEAAALRARAVATKVAMGGAWPFSLAGLRAALHVHVPAVHVSHAAGVHRSSLPLLERASLASTHDFPLVLHTRLGPLREDFHTFLEYLCDVCHDRFLDSTAFGGGNDTDDGDDGGRLVTSAPPARRQVVWLHIVRLRLAHRRLNFLVRVGVLRVVRWLLRMRRQRRPSAAPKPVVHPSIAKACPRCTPILSALVTYIEARWSPTELRGKLLDQYAELVCATCRTSVLYVAAAAAGGESGEQTVSTLRGLVARQHKAATAMALVVPLLMRNVLRRNGHQHQNPSSAQEALPKANESAAGPPKAVTLPVASCTRCGPLIAALESRANVVYHRQCGTFFEPSRTADERSVMPLETDFDFMWKRVPIATPSATSGSPASLAASGASSLMARKQANVAEALERVDPPFEFVERFLALMCSKCRSNTRVYFRRTLFPRVAVANHGVIRAKMRFLKTVFHRRAGSSGAPAGECVRCHPIKQMFQRRVAGSRSSRVSDSVMRSYSRVVCLACRAGFVASAKALVREHAAQVRVQTLLRSVIFRRRVLPMALRVAQASVARVGRGGVVDLSSAPPIPELVGKALERRWTLTPGAALVVHLLVGARKPACSLPCPGRCMTLTVAFAERVVASLAYTAPTLEAVYAAQNGIRTDGLEHKTLSWVKGGVAMLDAETGGASALDAVVYFLSAKAQKFSGSMCDKCRKAVGTLHPNIADYAANALDLPPQVSAPSVRLISVFLLMVRFVQDRRRWIVWWRRFGRARAEAINAADPHTARCARCVPIVRQLQLHAWRSWKPRSSESTAKTPAARRRFSVASPQMRRKSLAPSAASVGPSNLMANSFMSNSMSVMSPTLTNRTSGSIDQKTEAELVVYFAERYEHVLCAGNCRAQRHKWISTTVRQQRLAIRAAARWRWAVAYPRRLALVSVHHAFLRAKYPVCERCTPLLWIYHRRRDGLRRAEADGKLPAWKLGSLLDRCINGYRKAFCDGCKGRLADELRV